MCLQYFEEGDDSYSSEQTRQQIIYSITAGSHPQYSHPSRTCVGRDAERYYISYPCGGEKADCTLNLTRRCLYRGRSSLFGETCSHQLGRAIGPEPPTTTSFAATPSPKAAPFSQQTTHPKDCGVYLVNQSRRTTVGQHEGI